MANIASELQTAPSVSSTATSTGPQKFVLPVVSGVAFAHLLNDLIQAVLPSVYPILKSEFSLNFTQIGWISLIYQITASLLQPWIGLYTDKRPKPYLLPFGMVITFVGVGMLSISNSYPMLLFSAALVGVGSATFHPEASRIARLASGGRFGTAQSLFQVGGNTGSAIGPLMVAVIVIPWGQSAIGWFMLVAALAIWVLLKITHWRIHHAPTRVVAAGKHVHLALNRRQVVRALVVIGILMFAKFVYIAAFTNYFTFNLIRPFD